MAGSNELELSRSDKTESIIKNCQIVLIAFISANIVGFAILLNVVTYRDSEIKRKAAFTTAGHLESYGLVFTGVCLFVNVFWLINRLKKKQSLSKNADSAAFNKEICILWVILSTFSITYFIRVIWSGFVVPHLSDEYYWILLEILLGLLYDLIPVTLVLFLHLRNFREKNEAQNELRKMTGG